MKGLVTVFLLFCSVLSKGSPDRTPGTPYLTAEERAKTIKLLVESQEEFLAAVEHLNDAQWAYKPSPFRWSVGEVAEHIMLSEGQLFAAAERALAEKPDPEWEAKTRGKTELLERVLPSRERKAQAPERIQPLGKLSRAEILSRFKNARAKTLEFVRQTEQPIKSHTFQHPFPVFGTLNAYQWLIYIPLHNMRHNRQIAEVKADRAFPR